MLPRFTLKTISLIAGPLLSCLLFLFLQEDLSQVISVTASIAVWCVVWWIFEPVPIPITSLIPIAIFPLTGVLTSEQVAAAYGNKLVLLLLGGVFDFYRHRSLWRPPTFSHHYGQLVWKR